MDNVLAMSGPTAGTDPTEKHAMDSARQPGPLGRFYGIVRRPRPYLRGLYLVTSFPAGLAYFILLVTLGSLGLGMAVTVVGLPLLIAVIFGWCALATLEVARANTLAQAAIERPRFAGDNRMWRWNTIKARLGDALTWRSLALLLLMFPIGIAVFTIVAVALWLSVGLISFPFIAEFSPDGLQIGPDSSLDDWWQGALIALAGLVTFPAALWLFDGLGGALAGFVAWTLGLKPGEYAPAPAPAAGSAAQSLPIDARPVEARTNSAGARPSSGQLRALRIHAWFAAGLLTLLAVINFLSTPGAWWVAWPAWAISMPLALHAGAVWKGWLGAHFGFWAALMVGLVVIDATYSGASWAWWPLLATGSLLALHWFLARRQAPFPAPQSAATAGLVVLPEGDPPAAAGTGPEPAPISIDVVMRTVKVGGSAIEVTPREFELLALLAQHPGRPFSRDDLLDRIWKNDYEVTDRTIDTHIQRLRRKLGAQAEAIETVWGIGYRFRAEEAS